MILGENERLIWRYEKGKLRESKKGVYTKYNEAIEENLSRLSYRYRTAIWVWSTIRKILEITQEEYGVDTHALTRTCWNLISSLSSQRKKFISLIYSVQEYGIETKELVNAFRSDIKKSDNRIARLYEILIPEYLGYCGLIPYVNFLALQGLSFQSETKRFFDTQVTYEKEDFENASDYYSLATKQYYDYICDLFKKNGQEIRPDVEAIKEYNEFHKAKLDKINREVRERKESDKLDISMEAMRTKLGRIHGDIMDGDLDRREYIGRMIVKAIDMPEKTFSIVAAIRPGSKKVHFLINKDGLFKLNQTESCMNAYMFCVNEEEIMKKQMGSLKESGYIVDSLTVKL